MNTSKSFRSLRVLLATAAGAFGIATILASGGGGGGGTDENGNPLPEAAATWFKSFGGPNDDIAYSAIPTRDGGFAFAGVLNNSGGTGDFWLTKLDADGDVDWHRAYGDRLLLQDEQWSLVSTNVRPAQGADGSIWFLGSGKLDNTPGSHDNLVVAKLDADGEPAWAKSFDSGAHPDFSFWSPTGEAHEEPQSVTPLPGGGALVAAWIYVHAAVPVGSAAEARELRYLWLLKLTASGDIDWAHRITADQFLYRRKSQLAGGDGHDAVVVKVLENGDMLISVITQMTDWWCSACDLQIFVSTRFLHVRSTSQIVVNTRIPSDAGDLESRALPAATALYADSINVPVGYILAGGATDENIGQVDFGASRRAMIVEIGPGGDVEGEHVYDEWDEGTQFATVDRLCRTGTECGYVATLAASSEVCLREPMLVHLSAGLNILRKFRLVDANDPLCRDTVPVRLELEILAENAVADMRLFERGRQRRSDGSRLFGMFSARIEPGLGLVMPGTFAATSIAASLETLSVTPDGQALGIVATGEAPAEEALTRKSTSGDVTLSRMLRASTRDHGMADAALALAQAADEGFIAVGRTNSFDSESGSSSAWAVRTDRTGRVTWQRRLPGLVMRTGAVPNVLAGNDGFIFGAFMKNDGSPVVVRLDTRGDILWLARLPVGECSVCEIRLAALPNGDVIAAGTSQRDFEVLPWLARVNALGGVQWTRRYGLVDWMFTDVDITPDGNVLVTGLRRDTAATWRFSPDGDLLWNRAYAVGSLEQGMAATPDNGLPRAAVLPDGGFLVGMSVVTTRGEDNVLLLRADASGVAQWERLIGARHREVMNDLRVLSDGGALLSGYSNSLGDNLEAWVARLGADGRVSAGCNAGLGDYSQRLGTAVDIAAQNLRTEHVANASLPPADMRSLATSGQEFIPSAAEVVVARQCSGTASPENPPPAPARFQLTVTPTSALPGAVISSPGGIACGTVGGACSAQFDAQAIVSLRPDSQIIPAIDRWEGCDTAEAGVCIVRMTAAREVRLFLRADGPKLLTITSITGHGSVTDNAALDCNSGATGVTGTCSVSYANGSVVTVIAEPGAGQSFQAWGGDCLGLIGNPTRAELRMDANRTCTAAFTGVPAGSPNLTIVPEAIGLIGPADPATIGRITSSVPGIDCGSDCSERYPQHSNVTVTAEVFPAQSADWEFERFVCPNFLIPPDQVNGRSASIQLTGDVTCTARFRNTIKRLYLDMTNEGFAQGRVVSDTQRLDCTADCDRPFDTGTLVTLRARPAVSAQFRTWQNCDTVIADPDPGVVPLPPGQPAPLVCVVQMNTTRTVAAFFEPFNPGGDNDRTLTVAFSGSPNAEGMVFSIPAGIECTTSGGTCTFPFASGTVVRLMAGTQPGTLFDRFVGCTRDNPDGDPSTNDCEVNMVDDRFIQIQLLRP